MSTLIFPSSPTNGQIYPEQPIPGVNQYIYNAQSDTWDLLPADCCVPNNNIILDNIAGYFNGTQTTFALTVGGSPYEPPNALQMIVTVGNIMQEALVDYDISGSTITFTTAPAAGLDCVLLVIAGGQAAPASNLLLDDIQSGFNGTQVTFPLLFMGEIYTPVNEEQLVVNLGGIQQKPNEHYTVSGASITFTTPPVFGLNCFIIALYGGGFGAPGGSGGVTQIVAGTNVTVDPVDGTGVVTINASGGGSSVFSADTDNNIWSCNTNPAFSGGYNNFFAGEKAGCGLLISGYNNNFIGTGSGVCNSDGSYNNYIGYYAGGSPAESHGYGNNFIGYKAGYNNVWGSGNTYIGSEAGFCSESNYSILIGERAGYCNQGGRNIFLGEFSGYYNTEWGNFFAGRCSGFNNTTGYYNIFLGDWTGYSNTAGFENVLIGTGAGRCNTTGNDNVFIGLSAGQCNTTGSYNVFLGTIAGRFNSTGCCNVVVGDGAGIFNWTGCQNTFLGSFSGYLNQCGVSNTFVGFQAGQNSQRGCNNTFVGTNAGKATYDMFHAYEISGGFNNTFIGVEAGSYTFDYSNTYDWGNNTFVGACSGRNSKLNLCNVFVGTCAGGSSCSTNNNTFIGTQAGETSVNSCNLVAIGTCAGRNAGGYNNIFLGIQSGYGSLGCYASGNVYIGSCVGYYGGGCYTFGNVSIGAYSGLYITEATKNVFLGYVAGLYNTTGDHNIFVGNAAGYGNTTGYSNVFVGCYAGRCNTTGFENIFIGKRAGACSQTSEQNVFIGLVAGEKNTTGTHNVFVGRSAGENNTTGFNNVFLGKYAGISNTTGSDNIYAGDSAGAFNTTGSSNVYIGKQAGGASGGSNASGNVYLGNRAGLLTTSGCYNTFLGFEPAVFHSTGSNNVALGCKAGQDAVFLLTTESNRIIVGNNAHTNAYIKVNWTVTSDERDKTCITPIRHGSNFLNQLTPIQYNWKDRESGEVTEETPRYGFLAQEILAAEGDPAILVDDHDPDNLKLRETMMIPVLVKAFQELSEKYEELANELATLKSQLN